MARINGHGPSAPDSNPVLPPHLPYVLLCQDSGARCGHTFVANKLSEWPEMLNRRRAHESVCTVLPVAHLILPGRPV